MRNTSPRLPDAAGHSARLHRPEPIPQPGTPVPGPPAQPPGPDVVPPEIDDPLPTPAPVPVREPRAPQPPAVARSRAAPIRAPRLHAVGNERIH